MSGFESNLAGSEEGGDRVVSESELKERALYADAAKVVKQTAESLLIRKPEATVDELREELFQMRSAIEEALKHTEDLSFSPGTGVTNNSRLSEVLPKYEEKVSQGRPIMTTRDLPRW